MGTIPVDIKELGVDLLSLAGSQFYGPKGAGALFIRRGTRVMPLIDGGIQERGRRAGTENVPAIVGLGVAAELAKESLAQRAERLIPLRDRLIERLALSKFHMFGLGTWMMKNLMGEVRMPSLEDSIATAKRLGVKFVACTTSTGVMGLDEDAFIPEVDSFAGAATFLGEARKGTVNLFI